MLDELKTLLKEAEALIVRNRTQVNQELLDAAPNLKVVGRLGVGLDNIDLTACEKRGVAVCPASHITMKNICNVLEGAK